MSGLAEVLERRLAQARKLARSSRERWARRRERLRAFARADADWERLPEQVYRQHAPVFVLSTGRCGTELLTRLFDRLDGVACHHAPEPELFMAGRAAYEEGAAKFDEYVQALRCARFELVADAVLRGRVYVETNFRATFFAPHAHALFERSRFVHLVRHPGAFVRSGLRRGYYTGRFEDLGRIRPRAGEVARDWPGLSGFARNAWLWNETQAAIERFKETCAPERMLTVTSEELFSEPDCFVRIATFAGLLAPAREQVARWLRRPVNAERGGEDPGRFESWTQAQRDEVRRYAPLAERYGYRL